MVLREVFISRTINTGKSPKLPFFTFSIAAQWIGLDFSFKFIAHLNV